MVLPQAFPRAVRSVRAQRRFRICTNRRGAGGIVDFPLGPMAHPPARAPGPSAPDPLRTQVDFSAWTEARLVKSALIRMAGCACV